MLTLATKPSHRAHSWSYSGSSSLMGHRYIVTSVISRKWECLRTVWSGGTRAEKWVLAAQHFKAWTVLSFYFLSLPFSSFFLSTEDLHPASVCLSIPRRALKTHALGYHAETDSAVGEEPGKSLRCSSGSSDAR